MSVNPEVIMNEKKRKAIEWAREKYQDKEAVRKALLAAGSVKTKIVIDSQEIMRIERGKA